MGVLGFYKYLCGLLISDCIVHTGVILKQHFSSDVRFYCSDLKELKKHSFVKGIKLSQFG
jgi:hypothetical protein